MEKSKTFRQMRDDGVIKRADARKIIYGEIYEEEGFNLRDYDEVFEDGLSFLDKIRLLADFIADGGMIPALEVRPRPGGGVFIVDGHRRWMAIGLLISEGRLPADPKDGKHWIDIVPFEGNDVDRTVRVITSQQNEKLSPIALSRGYLRLVNFGWTASQIAKRMGRSPSHVEQYLDLATKGNHDVHQQIKAGIVKATVAIKAVREHGDEAGKMIAAEHAANGGKRVTRVTEKLTFSQWWDRNSQDIKVAPTKLDNVRVKMEEMWNFALSGKACKREKKPTATPADEPSSNVEDDDEM